MAYAEKTAKQDAEALLAGPMKRKNHSTFLRDEIAARLQLIVDREVERRLNG